MACATLFPSHGSKRRIDSVDGVDQSGVQCKRSPNLDFGLSSASFGSPTRLGRSPPPSRDAGRLSPKYFAKSSGSSSPALSFASVAALATSTATSVKSPDNPLFSNINEKDRGQTPSSSASKNSVEREPHLTAQQVINLCKQELQQLDNRLRHEYEQALQDKLAEQYHAFIQFAQDELQTSMAGIPPDSEMSYIG